MSNVAVFEKEALKETTKELMLNKEVEVKDIALANDEAISNLSEQTSAPRYAN